MTKQELLSLLSEKTGLNKRQADSVLSALAEAISNEVAAGRELVIPGIGKIKATTRAARQQRNPRTGEVKMAPEKRVIKVVVAKSLKDVVA